jgi:hypothetical protein
MDFTQDLLKDGLGVLMFSLIDVSTRECVALHAAITAPRGASRHINISDARDIARAPLFFNGRTEPSSALTRGSKRCPIRFYFSTPHPSWERGPNENTNQLIRPCLAKRHGIVHFTRQGCDGISNNLRRNPPKRQSYRTPEERNEPHPDVMPLKAEINQQRAV